MTTWVPMPLDRSFDDLRLPCSNSHERGHVERDVSGSISYQPLQVGCLTFKKPFQLSQADGAAQGRKHIAHLTLAQSSDCDQW